MVAPLRDKKSLRCATVDLMFFFLGLEPDGCLVADQIRIRTKNLRKARVQASKRGSADFGLCPCKKKCSFFCDGEVFSLDRCLLMGATATGTWRVATYL